MRQLALFPLAAGLFVSSLTLGGCSDNGNPPPRNGANSVESPKAAAGGENDSMTVAPKPTGAQAGDTSAGH